MSLEAALPVLRQVAEALVFNLFMISDSAEFAHPRNWSHGVRPPLQEKRPASFEAGLLVIWHLQRELNPCYQDENLMS